MTDSNPPHDLAIVGLGVMGANLARNFASRGYQVGGYDRKPGMQARLRSLEPGEVGERLHVSADLKSMIGSLKRPRRVVVLVPSKFVDDAIDELAPLLEADDVVVDAGNSLYEETARRHTRAQDAPWRFVGMGVSGGAEGALRGPSMMPGGDVEAWGELQPLLESAAAKSEFGACVAHCGKGAAGHFVKMTHNGIEYGDMQLLAETTRMLRAGLGLSATDAGDVFSRWNEGPLGSYLVEITGKILRHSDPNGDGPLVDAILDEAGQKGTGRWTVVAANELAVPVPTIAAAVDARVVSSFRASRQVRAGAVVAERGALKDVSQDDLEGALLLAKFASYAQGFRLMRGASEQFGFESNFAEIARIWTAGCIIRASLLRPIRDALVEDPARALFDAPHFVSLVKAQLPKLRRVVAANALAGHPAPAFNASLGWVESWTSARSTANVIQAQRDYFGSHTYRRRDAPDVAVHTKWNTDA
ncbi:MAG: NADP-dependent phosphogluconate dehydrogenase [Myxococcota bacterium]